MAKKVICIDLGSTQTRVWLYGKGNIFDEPTALAIDLNNRQVIEIGYLADKAAGRNPSSVDIVRPVRDGAIASTDMCALFIYRVFANQGLDRFLRGATVIVSRPNRVTDVERQALNAVFHKLRAKQVIQVPGAEMAALGAGIDTSSPRGILAMDIGGGTSDCAAVALGKIAVSYTVKVGGTAFDNAIIRYCKRARNLVLGPATAESCKMRIGSLNIDAENQFLEVMGRDVSTGLPSSAILSTAEIRPVLLPLAEQIADMATEVIQDVEPEMAADLVRSGVLVSGAGAQLGGMKEYLTKALRIPVHFATDMPNGTMLGLQRYAERMFPRKK